ncbi:MAG: hypothetical protein ABIK98_12420 [Pseudomonadota bacterium]
MCEDKDNGKTDLLHTVIEGGYCIGCGVFAVIPDLPFRIILDAYGCFQSSIVQGNSAKVSNINLSLVCPFSGFGKNEDEIAEIRFGDVCQYHDKVGYSLSAYAGYIGEGKFRWQGSSGVLGSWLPTELIKQVSFFAL